MFRVPVIATGLVCVGAVVGCALMWIASDRPTAQAQQTRAQGPATPAVMNPDVVTVRVLFGWHERQPSEWNGQVQLSQGKLLQADVWRRGKGDRIDDQAQFKLRTRTAAQGRRRRVVTENGLLLSIDAPSSAQVQVTTDQGDFRFRLSELASGQRLVRLERRVSIDLVANAVPIAQTAREEDFPAAAAAPDGTVYAAYIAHAHFGSPNLNRLEAVPQDLSQFRPSGGGDQLMTTRLDGTRWSPPVPLTEDGLDLWRPAVAVDGRGNAWVIWSQNVGGNWDLYARSYDRPAGKWSDSIQRLTSAPGADIHAVAARAGSGDVWLAWQGWRDGRFEILVATLGPDGLATKARLGAAAANQWSPAIAADGQGNVYVAFDTYASGNYDVKLCCLKEGRGASGRPQTVPIAASRRFEVRPSLVCDAKDRLWIAWEERAVNWGKDDWGAVHPGPGAALYRTGSTVRVACWTEGKLHRTAGDLLANFKPRGMGAMNSFPRLGADRSGRVWLALRHRGQRRAPIGTYWESYVTAYDGTQWSAPTLVTYSDNLLDNRPVLLGRGAGQLLLVYSGDGRNRFTQRDLVNNQLFAALVKREGPLGPPALVSGAAAAEPEGEVAAVHPNEPQDIARIRAFRLTLAGKTYRLMRGEFHRHTEISGDGGNDGALEDMWRYALDAARMDWIGNGDHDNGGGREYPWWIIQKTTDIFHLPPDFVPMFTYERSVRYPDGHRNVMFAQRGVRTLPRLRPQAGEKKPNNVSDQDTPMLYRYLKQFDGICAVHTSATGMGTDWRDNDPTVEPVVEIYQGDRHNYEHAGAPRSATEQTQIGGWQPAGFVWNALQKGYRLGFQASSDHISTHISYAVALAEQPTRRGVLEAFKKRHCYGATDNIILVVTSGEHLMGDDFTTGSAPRLQVTAIGTEPIARLSVIKDLKYVYSTEPNRRDVKLRWTDRDAAAGRSSLYYVRIEQADGQLAWASPLWIRYQP